MSVSKDFVAYVLELLAPIAGVTSRRMFGGVGLYADGLFFGLIDDDTLFFKVDDSNRSEYERAGSKPFCPTADKRVVSMNYFSVPAGLLDDAEDLSRWARKSLVVAFATASKKRAAKAKPALRQAVQKKASRKRKTAARKKVTRR